MSFEHERKNFRTDKLLKVVFDVFIYFVLLSLDGEVTSVEQSKKPEKFLFFEFLRVFVKFDFSQSTNNLFIESVPIVGTVDVKYFTLVIIEELFHLG